MKFISESDQFFASSRPRRGATATTAATAIISSIITAILTTVLLNQNSTRSSPLAAAVTRPLSILDAIPSVASHRPVAASPKAFTFPLENGFPFPDQAGLEEIWATSGGNISNGQPAGEFSADSLTDWKLQTFNEFFEVAFFTQLITNITNRVPGFEVDPSHQDYLLSTLKQIQAQEELHAWNANDAVRYFTDGHHMHPCAYVFPGVSDLYSAIALAQTFTDMYLGLLTELQRRTAQDLGSGGNPIVYVLAQALGQEGQQSGWFRALLGKHPSAQPFLAPSTRDLHFSWLQQFLVPGSCPNITDLPLQVYKPLEVTSHIVGSGPITLRVPGKVDPKKQRIAYVNGALIPNLVPFKVTGHGTADWDSESAHKSTEITVDFPFARNVMHGLTIAAVVEDGPNFGSALDVANATVYGPAVIEVA